MQKSIKMLFDFKHLYGFITTVIILMSLFVSSSFSQGILIKEHGDRMPLLMPDDFSEMKAVAWRVEPGKGDKSNPLIEGEMPWDAGSVMSYGTVLIDPIDGLWKAWIFGGPAVESTVEDLNTKNKANKANEKSLHLEYFESKDGVHWTRPELPNPYGEYKTTNLIFDGNVAGGRRWASVIVNPDNKEWPYEMFIYANIHKERSYLEKLWNQGYSMLSRYRSKDGKAWECINDNIKGPMDSAVSFVYPDGKGGYITYYCELRDVRESDYKPVWDYAVASGAVRTVSRAVSKDGDNFVRKPDRILVDKDVRDHPDAEYFELVPIKVKGGYISMITMDFPINSTLNLRMGVSRDGINWWYPDRRQCLDNAPLGDYGGGMIFQTKNLIVLNDTLYVYYGGSEGVHADLYDTNLKTHIKAGMEYVADKPTGGLPANGALCRALWRFDRMYALVPAAGGPTLGTAVTKESDLTGKKLHVNLKTRPPKKVSKPGFDEGYLQVELLDSEGDPISGFTRTDCSMIKGDHKAIQVKWAGGEKAPKGAKKAKFYLKRTFLYGFEFYK